MGVLDSSCVCEEDDAKVEPAMMNTTTRDEVAWIKAVKVRLVPASYQGLRILDEVATTALPSAEDMCTTPRVTMLKVLCGVMQFWFDIDGQCATPAVWLDIPEKSLACYGVLPPLQNYRNSPVCTASEGG